MTAEDLYQSMNKEELIELLKMVTEENELLMKKHSKLGLNFETPNNRKDSGKEKWDENIAHIVRKNIPYLKKREDKTFIVDAEKPTHTLIKGDNFPALLTLIPEYKNSIDVIYIDPPYNTGNSNFVYNDNYKDKNDNYFHSSWLSFMARRLLLAQELLSDGGIIFVSIDENSQAPLKMLMDEIFGIENFLTDFIRKTRTATSDSKTGVNIQHESTLCFAKNKKNIKLIGEEKDLSRYKNLDNDPNGEWASSNPTAASGSATNVFPIVNHKTGKVDYPPPNRYWSFTKKTLPKHIASGKIAFKDDHKPHERGFIYKGYLKDLKSQNLLANSLDFSTSDYLNSFGTKALRNILQTHFSSPKPVQFVKKLIDLHPNKNATILDFFAGSGTTGHAVAELNNEDNGNRKSILITDSGKSGNSSNNDTSSQKDDQIDIAEDITFERMRRIFTGENWIKSDKAVSLRQNLDMFEVNFINNNDYSYGHIMQKLEENYVFIENINDNELTDKKLYAKKLYNRWIDFSHNEKGDLSYWD